MTEQQVRDLYVSRGPEGVLLVLADELEQLAQHLTKPAEPVAPVTPPDDTEDK